MVPRCACISEGFSRESRWGHDKQARFYLPQYGRFASTDPALDQHFEFTQSWNIYSYVRNQPTMSIDPDGKEIRIANDETLDHMRKSMAKVLSKDDRAILNKDNFTKQKDGSYIWKVDASKDSSKFVKDLSELSKMKDKTANIVFLKDDGVLSETGQTAKNVQDTMKYAGATPTPRQLDASGKLVDAPTDFLNSYTFDMTNNSDVPTTPLKEMKMGETYIHEAVIHALQFFKGLDSHHGTGNVNKRTRELRKEVVNNYDPKASVN